CNTTKCGGDSRAPGMQQRIKGDGCAISDTCGNTDLADQVKPASIPAPGRPTTPSKTKLGGPVIEATGGRVRRGQFGHAQRDDDHEDRYERPTNGGGRIPSIDRGQVKEGDTSTQDRDNSKRNGEVGESSHSAKEFLRIA